MAITIPDKLLERLRLLGLDESVYSIRSCKCMLSREKLQLPKVPWYGHAYYTDAKDTDEGSRMNRSKTELTHKVRLFVSASVCLVFDPVSLVPCLALEPKEDDCILDMCAAPGTKTFILSFLTNNNANIIANDVNLRRVMRLRANAEKYGINCTITSESGRTIKGNFSKILVDAPCSGEGMINKKEKVFASWSERRIRFLAKKQKKLIKHAFEILEPGGVLVYSTCTFAPEENEGIIDFLLNKFDNAVTEEINVNINHASAITEWNGIEFKHEVSKGMRIYPHHNNTGGFFVARVRKG